MKVKYAESNVLGSGGLGETRDFKIRTNAHAFKMLSSGLYSDKIGAVLREIGCNAHDAHISGGIAQKPIEVKMPNGIDNQFYIRDFGPGLSYEEVMNLYTTYFASTKQESDDFTGGFGLGSKSPFSYTDSFMIVSHNGGKQMTFTAHIGNDGSPKIALMTEAPTTETGIKIGFSVPASDFASFQSKAQEIYQYFNPLPTILGGDDIRPLKVMRDFGRYAVLGDGQNYRSANLKVQMGNVVYPVNFNQLLKIPDKFVESFRYSGGLLFRMKIGSLSVAASREELQYDESTIKAITGEMKAIVGDVCAELDAALTKVSNWKELCGFHGMYNTLSRGLTIDAQMMAAVGIKSPQALYSACRQSSVTAVAPKGGWPENITVAICREMRQSGPNFCMMKEVPYSLHEFHIPLREDLVIVSGLETLAANRIRQALKSNKYQHILAVYPAIGKTATQTELDAVVNALTKATGKIDQVALGTLDKPTVTRIKRPKLPAGQFPDGDVYNTPELDNIVKASSIKDKVYVLVNRTVRYSNVTSRFHISDTKNGLEYRYWHYGNFEDHLATVRKFTTIAKPVFVTPSQMKAQKMADNPAWEEYGAYLRRVLMDPTLVAKLQAEVKDYVPKVDLLYSVTTPLECLVQVKHRLPNVWNAIKPTAVKSGVLTDIERVYTASIDTKSIAKKTPELISHYRYVVTTISDPTKITNLPDLDRAESAVNKKLSNKFRRLNSQFIFSVAGVSEAACTTILNEALT